MYLRPIYRNKDGKRHAYWALMESVYAERGPRSHVVAYLGSLPASERQGFADTAQGRPSIQRDLFEEEPAWLEVDTSRVRVERLRAFGGPWLGRELLRLADLDLFLSETLANGCEEIPWAVMA